MEERVLWASCCPQCDAGEFYSLLKQHFNAGTLPVTDAAVVNLSVECERCGEVKVRVDVEG